MSFKVVAIIPARMASQRLPNKPLLKIKGLEMIEHVRRRALLCKDLSRVVIATCDQEIANVVENNGGEVIMTSEKHPCATDRIAEAAQEIDCTHVINLQGDEILILPEDLSLMIAAMKKSPQNLFWNAVAAIEEPEELCNPSIVKCVVSKSDQILFCARDFSWIPFREKNWEPVCKVLGILGYKYSFLHDFSKFVPTPIEKFFSIEQMRILENDIPAKAIRFKRGYPGINIPTEVKLVEEFLSRDPRQQKILKEILQ